MPPATDSVLLNSKDSRYPTCASVFFQLFLLLSCDVKTCLADSCTAGTSTLNTSQMPPLVTSGAQLPTQLPNYYSDLHNEGS